MKIFPFSDLHLDYADMDIHSSYVEQRLAMLPTDVDVLVIAGDLASHSTIANVLRQLCDRYAHVVFVMGNHEFYRTRYAKIRERIDSVSCDNLYHLDNSDATVDGMHFVGTTLWFERTRKVPSFVKRQMNDFNKIREFEPWVYGANDRALEYLSRAVTSDSIVITHHLPTVQSIDPRFVGSVMNAYFVSASAETIIRENRPRYWIHGHTHHACNYMLENTRIICNPYGYPCDESEVDVTLRIS